MKPAAAFIAEAETSSTQGEFQILLRRPALPPRRLSWLTVSACPRNSNGNGGGTGSSYERIASVPILHVNRVPKGLARQAYGAVWDRVSTSRRDAVIAVAGGDDVNEWNRSGESTAENIARNAAVGRDDVVVEIGCGAGRVGAYLAPRCGEWIGCDVSANMLRHAAAALKATPNVRLVHLNGYDLVPRCGGPM